MPGLCITQGCQGILMPGRREACAAYNSLSRVSSSLGVSPHIIPLHFSLSVSRSLRLFLSLSLSQSLSLSLHFSAGTLWVSLSITPWFTPNSALRSQFLLLFGHLCPYEWDLDIVVYGLDSVICRHVVGVEVVITACAEVRPDGHLPG